MKRKSKPIIRVLQYVILVIATIYALYPVWFAILASGRLGDRLYTLDLRRYVLSQRNGHLKTIVSCCLKNLF